MSEAKVRGLVHVIEETKTFGQKGFRKRLVVLEQDKGRFTNYVPVEFVQDECDKVDQMSVGDEVEITYRLNGRKWQRDENSEVKYFLNAEALQFVIVNEKNAGGSTEVPSSAVIEDDDEVPF